jgi:hypothetical protein
MNKDPQDKIYHSSKCDGFGYDIDPCSFIDGKPIRYKRPCEGTVITFSVDFEPKHIRCGECMVSDMWHINKFKPHEMVRHLLENNFKREVYSYRHNERIEWDGSDDDGLYEVAYVLDFWVYVIRTPFDKFQNLWTSLECYEAMSEASKLKGWNISGHSLIEWNTDIMKKSNLMCKMASEFNIRHQDIELMIKNLKKKTNGISKQKRSVSKGYIQAPM